MAASSNNVWYFIIGGGFLGFWLFVTLFDQGATSMEVDQGQWALWGFLGIAIAGAFYAGRIANERIRIGIWITTGIFVGLIVAAAILTAQSSILATFIAGAGALLIAAGLPGNPDDERRRAEAEEQRRAQAAQYHAYYAQRGATQPAAPQPYAQGQWQPTDDGRSQQQSVIIHRQP